MVVNKFGKLCGPGAESVPTANSVLSCAEAFRSVTILVSF